MDASGKRKSGDHATLMDDNYRYQRHIYDLTRKYYLPGRDRLIGQMDAKAGQSVLELGCGTGRNLALVAKRYPKALLFGLDISEQMLATAQAKFIREGIDSRIHLVKGDATRFSPRDFGVSSFDHILISYALSMITDWTQTLRAATDALNPGGRVHVVDFGLATRLPSLVRHGLHGWLARYHVRPRESLREVAESICKKKDLTLDHYSAFFDYAQFLTISRSDA